MIDCFSQKPLSHCIVPGLMGECEVDHAILPQVFTFLHDRDARWEVDMDYDTEVQKYCHAQPCLCPRGRSHHTQIG